MSSDNKETQNQPALTELVNTLFAEDGLLSQLYGMEYREQQNRYALNVCQWLLREENPSVAMLEGETGIGKSLAYLLPLAMHLSLTGKRALISTYTVHLIHQLNNDKAIIRSILEHLKLRPVTVSNRLGRAQYISASRLLVLAESTEDPVSKKQLLALYKKVRNKYGPHIYVKYWSENAASFNLRDAESSIALTEHCSQEDTHWYQADCEAAGHSDIVLTSHTCSMLYARGIAVFKSEQPFSYLIADEADRLPEAAESILRLRSSPRRISSILQEIQAEAGWKGAETKKACASLQGLQRVLDESGGLFSDKQCVLSKELPSHASLNYISAIKDVMKYLKPMVANIPSSSEASADKVSAVNGFYNSLNNVLSDKKQANCIAWSPVNRQGSIAIDDPFAGLSFSKFARGIGDNQPPLSVMLTSGTLGVSGKSGLTRYTPIRAALGLKESDIKIWGHYAPKHYGEVRFILAADVAKPFFQ